MTTLIYLIWAVFAFSLLYLLIRVIGGTYLKYRGTRVITCPENKECVAVKVDAKDAALSATLGQTNIHLKDCSRWPEKRNCGQECLKQVSENPADCLFQNILKSWYEGKSCVFCHKAIGEIDWKDYKPGLLSPDNKTVEWSEVAPEKVYEVLKTHSPVCSDCYISETFRRQFPELVIERPWKGGTVAKIT